ncbi:hypothetical protein M0G43_00935 [Subsaxibacter sp. CAU 1640]|uniref:hypothetical protein n=1 Tax=Subsaxibacter sp. CAU 1640 TaxID=2933271 RepID=UPI0020067A08|nr:hypothetical protein [Subsaxibacter sp. CAU 1640]MCK7589129.1 hypothetical protein [Subsaxibacter sp. CAU 1640]
MKALKITLLLALFVAVSSQTEKKTDKDTVDTYETTKAHYDLIAHSRNEVKIPDQG